MIFNHLLTDAEIAKDNVQDILHIDPARQAAERRRCGAQFFGNQLFPAAGPMAERTIQRCDRFLERLPVTTPCDDR